MKPPEKLQIYFFATRSAAELAYRQIVEVGVSEKIMSLLLQTATEPQEQRTSEAIDASINQSGGVGAGLGAVTGSIVGILAGIGVLAIPPMLALGPIAATITGGILGGISGGLTGCLAGFGISEMQIHEMNERIKAGNAVLLLHEKPKADLVYQIETIIQSTGGQLSSSI